MSGCCLCARRRLSGDQEQKTFGRDVAGTVCLLHRVEFLSAVRNRA